MLNPFPFGTYAYLAGSSDTNMFHDLMYAYGFTEEAGNFQQYNFGKGGKENDVSL